MTSAPRWLLLPVAAVVVVGGVIGVQVAEGGGSYEPLRPPSACAERPVTTQADGLEGLTERLVLIGLADAACTLGVSREALTLELAGADTVTDEQVDALREGLLSAVRRMKDDDTLPETSDVLDEALDNADLNGFVKGAIRALPDDAVNAGVQLDDVLERAIASLDIRELLANLDDRDEIEGQVNQAVTEAVKDSVLDRVQDLLPDVPDLPGLPSLPGLN